MKVFKFNYKKHLEFRDFKECYEHHWKDDHFILTFGTKSRGTIKDSNGKNCKLKVDYDKYNGIFNIYADYEGDEICIYSDNSSIEIFKHIFPLKKMEINLMKIYVQDLIMENPQISAEIRKEIERE